MCVCVWTELLGLTSCSESVRGMVTVRVRVCWGPVCPEWVRVFESRRVRSAVRRVRARRYRSKRSDYSVPLNTEIWLPYESWHFLRGQTRRWTSQSVSQSATCLLKSSLFVVYKQHTAEAFLIVWAPPRRAQTTMSIASIKQWSSEKKGLQATFAQLVTLFWC